MLQNVRVTTFPVFELSRENQVKLRTLSYAVCNLRYLMLELHFAMNYILNYATSELRYGMSETSYATSVLCYV